MFYKFNHLGTKIYDRRNLYCIPQRPGWPSHGDVCFRSGAVAGADIAGLTYSGSYTTNEGRVVGEIVYRMPKGSVSITGASFEEPSGEIAVPFDFPEVLNPNETYRISTPIGPLNAKFHKNVEFAE
ncbi:hypothetical protein [Ruegeria sp. HKCCA4707]|uniref:hypothetical protein n=1 Tax=Ruegeria sp. HKCCA4707 TaxID=2682984 RepID=UPI001488586A|nr:hypothetical protein [Ruegeria sp. HKCCA4707]